MKKTKTTRTTRGFTLIELLVTITLIGVLAAFCLTMVQRAGTKAKLTASVSQVRALGPILHTYAQEEGGRLPVWKDAETYWWEMIADPDEYDPENLFKSPGHREFDRDRVEATISYGWNAVVMGRTLEGDSGEQIEAQRMVNFDRPDKTLVLTDGARDNGFGLIEPGGPLPDPERYGGSVAALMLDGSARILNANTDFKSDSEWFETEEL